MVLHLLVVALIAKIRKVLVIQKKVSFNPDAYLKPSRMSTMELLLRKKSYRPTRNTAQKMKFSIKDFFCKCDHLENFIFCVVKYNQYIQGTLA